MLFCTKMTVCLQGERNFNRFGGWLGKNSTLGKNMRLLEDLHVHFLASRESNSGRWFSVLYLYYAKLISHGIQNTCQQLMCRAFKGQKHRMNSWVFQSNFPCLGTMVVLYLLCSFVFFFHFDHAVLLMIQGNPADWVPYSSSETVDRTTPCAAYGWNKVHFVYDVWMVWTSHCWIVNVIYHWFFSLFCDMTTRMKLSGK